MRLRLSEGDPLFGHFLNHVDPAIAELGGVAGLRLSESRSRSYGSSSQDRSGTFSVPLKHGTWQQWHAVGRPNNHLVRIVSIEGQEFVPLDRVTWETRCDWPIGPGHPKPRDALMKVTEIMNAAGVVGTLPSRSSIRLSPKALVESGVVSAIIASADPILHACVASRLPSQAPAVTGLMVRRADSSGRDQRV